MYFGSGMLTLRTETPPPLPITRNLSGHADAAPSPRSSEKRSASKEKWRHFRCAERDTWWSRIWNSRNPHGMPDCCQCSGKPALIKKEIKFSSYIRKFRVEQCAKSYMRKVFLIYEEMRKYFTIYEEAVSHI